MIYTWVEFQNFQKKTDFAFEREYLLNSRLEQLQKELLQRRGVGLRSALITFCT